MTETERLLTLMHNAKLLYRQAFEPLMARYDVNQLETDVVLFLHNNPDFDTAQSICDLRGLRKSNVLCAVEKLCARGWLARVRDEKNRRVVHLSLQEKASPFVAEAARVQRHVFARLGDGLTPEEKKLAESLMQKLTERAALLLNTQEE